jgi:hypothetical protein
MTGIRYLNFKDLTTNVFFTEKQETEKLILFPNPVKDQLYFNYSASSDIKLQIEIVASNGKVVFRRQIIRQSVADITTINVSPLPDGLYLFLLNDGKMVQTNKFLKIN